MSAGKLAYLVCVVVAANAAVYDQSHTKNIHDVNEYDGAKVPKPHKKIDDMMFTRDTWDHWTSKKRGIVDDIWYSWPKDTAGNVIVPYTLSTNLTVSTANIMNAMQQWSNKTCVKFYQKSDPNLPAGTGADWVVFTNPGTGGGCDSYIGRIHWGAQPLNLDPNCNSANAIAHEIGHALGFFHENQRSDRDEYLVSLVENILAGAEYNFDKDNSNNFGVPYNYLSVMHYFWNAFSIDYEKPTIMPKDPSLKYLLNENNPVSHYDALAANTAFGCLATWKTKCGAAAPVCKNFGYLSQTCTCICPTGTSGTDCGTKTASSLPAYPPPGCGGKITSAGNFSVPGMGGARAAGFDCTWYIEAPVCQISQITISAFKVYKDATYNCYFESMSVATKDVYSGSNIGPLCGTAVNVPDGTKYTGNPSMLLGFQSSVDYTSGAGGFKFEVKFLANNTCTTTSTTRPTTTLPTTTRPTTTLPTTTRATTTTAKPTTIVPSPMTTCVLSKINGTNDSIWVSPNYPGLAPANSRCILLVNTTFTGFNFIFSDFQVPASDSICTNAYAIFLPTFPLQKLCNIRTGATINVVEKYVMAQYQSDPIRATAGFKIIVRAY